MERNHGAARGAPRVYALEDSRESRYLSGLLAVRALPLDTAYLEARIIGAYRRTP